MAVFTIEGTLPGMNEIIAAARSNRRWSASQKKDATLRCALAFKRGKPFIPPCEVKIRWFEPTLKRDFDNVAAGVKFILDGMVAAGKIADDSRKFITSISHEVLLDRENPRIEVSVSGCTTPGGSRSL